jgi:iron(II)-dependent oxidoreductase
MDAVRANTVSLLASSPDPNRIELIARHELQHQETMLQAMQLAQLPVDLDREMPMVETRAKAEFIRIEAIDAWIGSDPGDGFSYDNERPRHRRALPAFEIAAAPVTNAQWQAFIDADGYDRRELWSDAGWDWRQAEAATRPLYWNDNGGQWRFAEQLRRQADEPVVHICCFEADAYARYVGARLPTEFEHEAAAAQLTTAAAVWEWTASEFDGYAGFQVDPYPEYSEQFFNHGYRVLRGGAYVTADAIATPQFRNWDHPQRRQIFSGVRIARDL